MQENIDYRCYLCGSGLSYGFASTDYITKEIFHVYRCDACSLWQTIPHLDTKELTPYYAGVYYKQRKSITDSHINKVRLQHIEKAFIRTATEKHIVDIGCGNGALIEMLIAHGWDAQGTEIAPPEHFTSDAVQKKIYIGEFTQASFPSDTFDVATIWHVLEHLPDPRAYLKELHRTQKRDGLLIIEVPNIDSWQAHLTKQDWFNLDVPRHLFHFTPESIIRLLAEEGYRVTRISHYSAVYSFFGWVQSLLNLLTQRNNILFDMLNKKITLQNYASHDIRWWELLTTIVLVLPCALLSLLLTLVETMCKKGGIITVYATHTPLS